MSPKTKHKQKHQNQKSTKYTPTNPKQKNTSNPNATTSQTLDPPITLQIQPSYKTKTYQNAISTLS